ncbi:post-GPI attachment to proteins factor 2-like [Mizuhopecten yessoensis]|uniref:post-GPI attachment to proteins factor 2-like n=1 Tax=Mizuhopecten yessoensis TaxID=6573 RepID=UPI000B45A1F3|nr:post-GPI attachment to proteins factor 2-like [Mizuhopecten yessoensis]
MAGPTSNTIFQVPFVYVAKTAVLLPLFGFLFCVSWSILYDFKSSTATHCKVANYLPSISSAIGGYTPQRYVWRICVALHCSPRLMFAISYYNFHTQVHVGTKHRIYKNLAAFASFLHVSEILALVGLTYISSTENPDMHEYLFIAFMVCSLFHMLLTCVLFHWGRTANNKEMTNSERQSFHYKVGLFLFNLMSFLVAVYLYFRHQAYCEPGMYTWFALGEYLTVISNIAYNGTVAWDFSRLDVSVSSSNGTSYIRKST